MPEFTTDWYQQENLTLLTGLAKSVRQLEGAYIEVGCWEGRSSIALANSINPERLFCIDTWAGSIPDGYRVDNEEVYDRFIKNMYECTSGNFVPYRMSWEHFEWNKPIKFIHIDAEHTYESVKGNIEESLLNMVSGGVICGDDYYHEPVREAVADTLPDAVALSAALWAWRAP